MKSRNILIATVGGLVGLSHIGMIALLVSRVGVKDQIPLISPPVGPYTSYAISASKDGYKVSYQANDPKTMVKSTSTKVKGLTKKTETTVVDEYTMDGKTHLGVLGMAEANALNVACIKAEGGGAQTGKVVGAAVGTAAGAKVVGVPFVGPVLGGLVALGAADKGADIGGQIATEWSEACDPDTTD